MQQYYKSMNLVYEYIDNNLAGDLSLKKLSAISGYSEYHFHRIFHALTSKTVLEYVLDRKCVAAACRLLYDDASITDIALDFGFSSSSNFARCFKKYWGCSPTHYKRYKNRHSPVDFAAIHFKEYLQNTSFDALLSVRTLPDLHVAGIPTIGLSESFEKRGIEKSFKRLFSWLGKQNLVKEDMTAIGITLDSPEVSSFSECRYFACVEVEEDVLPEGEIAIRTFATSGKYICVYLERGLPNFAEQFFEVADYLYGYYIPKLGKTLDSRPFVEIYNKVNDKIMIEFHVPIK